jgi:hypothetical protein
MKGNIEANLAAIPLANLIALFAGVAVLLVLAAVVTSKLVKGLGIKNIGPIKLEHQSQTTMHDMNEKIKDLDDLCGRQMRSVTDRMKIRISNIFAAMDICIPARVSVSSAIRFALYESIANNHFTTELMSDRLPAYRKRIIDTMKDEYVSLASAAKDKQCNKADLPPWDDMSGKLAECIDGWLKRIGKEVMDACDKKIAVYKKYQRGFEEAKDGYRAGICRECVEKNERYSRELKLLINREAA